MDNTQNGADMAKLSCEDCGEDVLHPVGKDGQKTLCRAHLIEHMDRVDLIDKLTNR
jgi:hypothetical protein